MAEEEGEEVRAGDFALDKRARDVGRRLESVAVCCGRRREMCGREFVVEIFYV